MQDVYENTLLSCDTPTWEKELQNVAVHERDTGVELVCSCRGLTNPVAKWLHKGREVFSDFHMKLKQVGETATLTIKSIRPQDGGTFKCMMIGDNGEIETSCVLSIKAMEIVEPPVFVKGLHDMEVEEGEKIELDVEVKGTPPVGILWYHNNVEITHGSPHFLMASFGHIHSLTLLNASEDSSGEYVCEAYSDFGDADTFCFVEVRGVDHPEPPDFVLHPITLSAEEGEAVTFSCQVKGQPKPTVLWERRGVVIATNEKYRITKIQDQHTLTINNTDHTDAGEYACHLHNSEDNKSHTFSLVVSNEPSSKQTAFSGPEHIRSELLMSQTDWTLPGERNFLSTSQQVSDRIWDQQNISERDASHNAEEKTTKAANKASMTATLVSVANTDVHSRDVPQTTYTTYYNQNERKPHLDNAHKSHNVTQSNLSAVEISERVGLINTGVQGNLPHAVTNPHSILNKNPMVTEEKRNVINTDATDFRNVLKHRDKFQPSSSTAKSSTQQSPSVDFRDFLKQQSEKKSKTEFAKGGNTSCESSVNISTAKVSTDLLIQNIYPAQVSNDVLLQNAEETSLSSLPSSVSSNKHQLMGYLTKTEAAGITYKTTTILKSNDNIKNTRSDTGEESLSSHHALRQNKSNPEYPEKSTNQENLPVSILIRPGLDYFLSQENKQESLCENFGTRTKSQHESIDCSKEHTSTDCNLRKNKSTDAKAEEPLFKSKVQVFEARTHRESGNDHCKVIKAEENFRVLSPRKSVTDRNQVKSESYLIGQQSIDIKDEQPTLNTESQQVGTAHFPKVSQIQFNSQMSSSQLGSKELKLEVTSISVSVPLRSPVSLPRLHSQRHSLPSQDFLAQSASDQPDMQQEDGDEVFTYEERESAPSEQNSSLDEYKNTSQSFGPIFTWEKAPWELDKDVNEKVLSEISNQNNIKRSSGSLQVLNKSRTLSSEIITMPYQTHQRGTMSVSQPSDPKTELDISTISKIPPTSKKIHGSVDDDFRSVKLKPSSGKGKTDLMKSKFISASTECVFGEVRLKPVLKSESWRKSQISLSSEKVKDKPKSRAVSEFFPSSARDITHKKADISSNKASPASKITFSSNNNNNSSRSDAKSKNPLQDPVFDNSTQKIKIKPVAETNEKSSPTNTPRRNTNEKSKGIGAKFEESIKDSKPLNSSNVHIVSSVAVHSHTGPNSSKLSTTKDVNYVTFSEKIKLWKESDVSSTQVIAKKMLGAIGKSSSNNALLEVARKSPLDKVKNRMEQKRHSLPINMAPAVPKYSQRMVHSTEHNKVNNESILLGANTAKETVFLNQTSDVLKKREFFEKSNKKDQPHIRPTDEIKTAKVDIPLDKGIKQSDFRNPKADISQDKDVIQSDFRNAEVDVSEAINMKLANLINIKGNIPQGKSGQLDTSDLPEKHEKKITKTPPNEQGGRPEWVNWKPVKNIEAKIKANMATESQHNTKPEWVNIRTAKQIKQTVFLGNNKTENNAGQNITSKSKEDDFASKITIKIDGAKHVKSLQINNSESLLKNRSLYDNDKQYEENKIQLGETSLRIKPSRDRNDGQGLNKVESKIKTNVNTLLPVTGAVTTVITSSTALDLPKSGHKFISSIELAATTKGTDTISGKMDKAVNLRPVDLVSPTTVAGKNILVGSRRRSHTTEGEITSPTAEVNNFLTGSKTRSNTIEGEIVNPTAEADRNILSGSRRSNTTESDKVYPIEEADRNILSGSRRRSNTTEGRPECLQSPDMSAVPDHDSKILGKETEGHHVSKFVSNNQFMQSSTEFPVHHAKTGKPWVRQHRSQPAHDIGQSSHNEQLATSMDDAESVVSTASISSSSSDSSNVTVDSGYPRSNSRSLVESEKISHLSKSFHHERNTNSSVVSQSRKLNNDASIERDTAFKMRKNIFEVSEIKQDSRDFSKPRSSRNLHNPTSDVNQRSRFREDTKGEISKNETPKETSTKQTLEKHQIKPMNRFVDYFKTSRNRWSKFTADDQSQVHENPIQASKEPESTTDPKESEEIADLTNDFGTTRKYSKKRRKQREGNSESENTTNRPNSSSEPERISSELVSNETDKIKFVSDTFSGQSIHQNKEKSKVTQTCFNSEDRENELQTTRSSLFRQMGSDEKFGDNSAVSAKVQEINTFAVRPSDLDLNPNWRSSRLPMKAFPKDNDSLPHKTRENKDNITASSAVEKVVAVTQYQVPPQPQLCPPSFPLPLRDATVILGSKAVLQCQVIGNPSPEVKWLLNQTQIQPSKNITILYKDSVAQLTVGETFTEHVGDYTCWARNTLGTVSSHCTLSLEVPNKTESRALEGRVFSPPRIVTFAPSIVYVGQGSSLTLTVTFMGEPTPDVAWMKDGKELISGGHVHILTEGNTSSLSIKSVTQTDVGRMSVCLTSCTGQDQATSNICIEDIPGAPLGQPHVYEIGRTSASLSWYGPASSEGNQVTYYIIEAKTRQASTWDVIVPHCKDESCHILGLKPNVTYQFRVLAANKNGVSVPSEPSERVLTSDPFMSPSDYESEAYAEVFTPSVEYQIQEEFPFEPREVKINTKDKFENIYELDKEVGKGKFGIVFKCKHKADGTVWAAKIVKCREKDKNVIRREIDIMNKLRHPKILLLWDAYESPRQMVLVMEYIGAGELFERVIGEDFVLTEGDCVHFLRQICEGVNYMHSNNILHLDLKPENILCLAENSNRIKIIDFGLAQFYCPGQSNKVLFGTPEFIAPEVVNYDEIGFETDMWSIGVICYVLLSGLSPFLGDNDAETLANVTSGDFDFDDVAFDEITDDAKNFISSLLVMRKENRMLTDQCLAHNWLIQNERGRVRCRRLNTERLKRFLVRRKWLKTGNALMAVNRLLRSSCLTLNTISSSNSSENLLNSAQLNPAVSSNSNDNLLNLPQQSSSLPVSTQLNHTNDIINGLDNNGLDVKVNSETMYTDKSGGNVLHLSDFVVDKINSLNEDASCINDYKERNKTDEPFINSCAVISSGETLTNLPENSKASHKDKVSHKRNPQIPDQNENNIRFQTSQVSASDMNHNEPPNKSSALSQSAYADISSTKTQIKEEFNKTETNQEDINKNESDVIAPQIPIFTKSMCNGKACTGDVARFDVIIFGEPFPHVTWYFEDKEIKSDSRHILKSSKKTRSFSLIIRGIEVEDEGEYSCKAVNSKGESICVAELSVLEV